MRADQAFQDGVDDEDHPRFGAQHQWQLSGELAAHHHACQAKNSFEYINDRQHDHNKGHHYYFCIHLTNNLQVVFDYGANYTFFTSKGNSKIQIHIKYL